MPALLPPARARLHQPNEAGHLNDFAGTLKVLARLRCDPARATTITSAIVALQHVEDPY